MRPLFLASLIAPVITAGLVTTARADITSIGPFSGAQHEPLNFPLTNISADQPIFGNTAHLVNPSGLTAIHLLAGDSFVGGTVHARTGVMILGWTQDPGEFRFNTPVTQFGAYWANNNGTDGAVASFYDAAGTLLGIRNANVIAAGNAWYWNGWQFDTPVSRISVKTNSPWEGWVWFDDLEMTPVPAPSAAVLLPILLIGSRRRRL